MELLDRSLPTPAENLALDEALLLACEEGRAGEALRFWESPGYFVVMGYSGKSAAEAHVTRCHKDGVPVLRRASGGGTVLQGPGCLNYSLILKIDHAGPVATLAQANTWIMGRQREALLPLSKDITVEGITDLAVHGKKFSGNAQRRLKKALLFHGTFLLTFNVELVEKYLLPPSRQPGYRKNREHGDFLANFPGAPKTIKRCLKETWGAVTAPGNALFDLEIAALVRDKYGNGLWNMKF